MRSCPFFCVSCAVTVLSIISFGYFLGKVTVPIGAGGKLPIFGVFPIIWAICFAWFIAAMVEASGAMNPVMNEWGNVTIFPGWPKCKTKTGVIGDSLGAKFPYPGQWGAPIFKGYAIGPMIGAMMVSMVESIGDYYACAKLAGAPPPSGSVISRGLASEGWGLMLCGLFGTGNGTSIGHLHHVLNAGSMHTLHVMHGSLLSIVVVLV